MLSDFDKLLTEYWTKKLETPQSVSFAKKSTYVVISVVIFFLCVWGMSEWIDHARAQKELDKYNRALEEYNRMK